MIPVRKEIAMLGAQQKIAQLHAADESVSQELRKSMENLVAVPQLEFTTPCGSSWNQSMTVQCAARHILHDN
ncbi:hypothetical protein e2017b09.tmp0161 [Eimeria tenella]|uniref:Uncharacterized protein n=1 Tax=Eimeria tenella TaxID=5802 RepID=C8TDW5_EIMTE|nr:hypothetical protein e2017b09.tmp0161 [Eimeria tenella]